MSKVVKRFVCQECGSWHNKWNGRCEGCNSWNTLVEEQVVQTAKFSPPGGAMGGTGTEGVVWATLQADPLAEPQTTNNKKGETFTLNSKRLTSEIQEFDRVCGGGLVPGSVILVGGDPGIGKSTLLLQLVSALSTHYHCAYVSGEEAILQIQLRAERLGLHTKGLKLTSSTDLLAVIQSLEQLPQLRLVIVDSIQTMFHSAFEAAPGTVSQVRACAHQLITWAKKNGIIVILVGHVTKEGVIAGPRVLEHMVDTVLYFEGERSDQYRILRSVKNRFGATDEIGVFEMTGQGLQEVSNPSCLFLSQQKEPVAGSAIFASIEGTRPILVEVQALVAPTYLASPRRTVVGWDLGRLNMILAVLESRAKLKFGNKDVFLNIAGGLKISEPAADLGVAAALISALTNQPIPRDQIFFGEIGLAGEIRSVNQGENRLKEAAKLGFHRAAFSEKLKENFKSFTDISQHPLHYVGELVTLITGR